MSQDYVIGEKTYRVRVGSGEAGAFDVAILERPQEEGAQVEARRFSARIVWVEGNTYALWLDGKKYLGQVVSGPEGDEVFIGGENYLVVPPQKATRRRAVAAHGAAKNVTPPMPGVVIKVLVGVGDRVEKGQGVIVVSAMKMETTLASPRSGIVTRINTCVEAQVKPGDVLIEVEEEEGAKDG